MIHLEFINNNIEVITELLKNGGIFCGILLVLLESIIPMLPLGVFIAFNINAFGLILGILISWIGTCLGCYLSFLFFRFLSIKFLNKHFKNKKLEKVIYRIKSITFSNLVVLIALPFTPAFLINIACGVVDITKKKFVAAIMVGKIFTVTFWGCIGKSLLASITDIKTIIIVSIFIVIAYFLSKLVSKKLEIE